MSGFWCNHELINLYVSFKRGDQFVSIVAIILNDLQLAGTSDLFKSRLTFEQLIKAV